MFRHSQVTKRTLFKYTSISLQDELPADARDLFPPAFKTLLPVFEAGSYRLKLLRIYLL